MMMAMDAITKFKSNNHVQQKNAFSGPFTEKEVCRYVSNQLTEMCKHINNMNASMNAMKEGCHPFIFYHRVRPFLSAWKHNPAMPNGVLYEGVSSQRLQYFGGSAAQSSLIPFLDITLGISHESVR